MRIVVSRLIIGYILLAVFIGLSFAQGEDAEIFPPITSENQSQVKMLQALSQGEIKELTWSPNGEQLVVTADGGTWVYDITQPNKPPRHLTENSLRSYVAYAPYDDIYISYSPQVFCPYGNCPGQQMLVRDANTHAILHEIWGMTDMNVTFSHDGELVAVASRHYGIVIWRTDSFRENPDKDASEFYQCQIKTPAEADRALFSHDDTLITYMGARSSPMRSPGDYSIWFWDAQTCDVHLQIPVFPDNYESYPPPIASMYIYSPKGPYAIVQDFNDRQLHIWDVQAKTDLGILPRELASVWGFTPDNRHLLLQNSQTRLAQIWNIETQTVTRAFYANRFFTFDDTSLLMLRTGNLYRVTETDEVLLRDDDLAITTVHLSDDKTWLFLSYEDNSVTLWDWTTDTIIEAWEYSVGTNLSPDKSKIVTTHDNRSIFIWDIANHERWELNYRSHIGWGAQWSDTDNTMVTSSERGFTVWTLGNAGFEISWQYPRISTVLAINDNSIMVMNDNTIEVWDVKTGELVTSFAPDDCQSDQTDPFCDQWNDVQMPHRQLTSTTPQVIRNGNSVAVIPDEDLNEFTYTIPDHILAQLDTFTNPQSRQVEEQVEWTIIPNGDLLVRFGYSIYNVTQDTAMRMGYVRAPDELCDDECFNFPVHRIWFGCDSRRLFASGSIQDERFPAFRHILIAWDMQTGRRLYDIRGNIDSFIELSHDEQYVFSIGSDSYVGGGMTIYDRSVAVFDAMTGEWIMSADTFDESASHVAVSPNRRFVIVNSDTARVWAVVED